MDPGTRGRLLALLSTTPLTADFVQGSLTTGNGKDSMDPDAYRSRTFMRLHVSPVSKSVAAFNTTKKLAFFLVLRLPAQPPVRYPVSRVQTRDARGKSRGHAILFVIHLAYAMISSPDPVPNRTFAQNVEKAFCFPLHRKSWTLDSPLVRDGSIKQQPPIPGGPETRGTESIACISRADACTFGLSPRLRCGRAFSTGSEREG